MKRDERRTRDRACLKRYTNFCIAEENKLYAMSALAKLREVNGCNLINCFPRVGMNPIQSITNELLSI